MIPQNRPLDFLKTHIIVSDIEAACAEVRFLNTSVA